MRYITMILLVVLLGVLAVPAWGEGPFQVRLPVQQTGIDPEADTLWAAPSAIS